MSCPNVRPNFLSELRKNMSPFLRHLSKALHKKQGQSVSCALLQFAPGGVSAPHARPRSAGLLLVLQGLLEVGLVDSNNTLFTQELRTGDLFVFPKGLVHFQANKDPRYPAVALAAFGSASAGTVSLPKALFGSGIDAQVLAKSFKTDARTIDKLVSAAAMGR